jgi:hypothetical protein
MFITFNKSMKQVKEMPKDKNYVNIQTKNSKGNKTLPIEQWYTKGIILNKYKTAKNYGQYEVLDINGEFPEDLSKSIAQFVHDANLPSGIPLFGTIKHQVKKSFNLLDALLKKVSGRNITSSSLRKAWISYTVQELGAKSKGVLTDADRNKIATLVGHSFSQVGTYLKTGLLNENSPYK